MTNNGQTMQDVVSAQAQELTADEDNLSEEAGLLKMARVVHESVRAINESYGDHSLPDWDAAEEWQRQSSLEAVRVIAANPNMSSEQEHARWMEDKLAHGWRYGPQRDDGRKVHPLLVPFAQLPPAARQKNALIVAVVRSLTERAEAVTVLRIAMAVHEMNRAWCEINGDFSQVPWAEAPSWQRQASIAGIQTIREHPEVAPGFQHEQWVRDKQEHGWRYGPVKDADKKEHPMLIPFAELPWDEQVKDAIFVTTAKMLLKLENRSFLNGLS